jgi:hypothetical protein
VRFVDHWRARHGALVDKKFLEGLSEVETSALRDIEQWLDASEARYYAPIVEALVRALAAVSSPS